MPFWHYLEQGGKRLDICAHRRWGKDDLSLHWTACSMFTKIGTYWHMLPEAAQARKAIWDAINPRTGLRRIDEAFPKELRESTRNDDMFIRFKNGSTWQVIGSDNYNSLVGSPPVGVIFSEWSLANPAAWSYIRPILAENGGWAVFIWTPRGRNHATRAWDARSVDSYWFAKKVPAAIRIDGKRSDEMPDGPEAFKMLTPVFTRETLWQELKEMIGEADSTAEGLARFGQEYLVDFDAPIPGAYYAEQIAQALTAGRIGHFPYDPRFPVSSSWDLGMDDYTAIWFWQRISRTKINAIDYYECSGQGFDDGSGINGVLGDGIVRDAFAQKWKEGWKFDINYLPHDVQVRELSAGGRTRRQVLFNLGVKPIRPGVAHDNDERVAASRKLLPLVHFNASTTEPGIDRLKSYRRKWNKLTGQFMGPLKDGNDHGADAFGEFAVNAGLPQIIIPTKENTPVDLGYHPLRQGQKSMNADNDAPNWKTA